MADWKTEIGRRRTFAIISHPDAGKTTITEKLLLHGGVIHTAGEVKGKAGTKAAKSDWMKLEQQRGVSITSSAMQFDFEGLRINLLDTPGHKDFGEDTYRTLVAADCAAMLIDAGKGVEAQTRKLYEVCRLRKMPMLTFANKMDREGKSPLDLIDDVENTLQMRCYPVTWPIGIGALFKGLFHRLENKLFLYERGQEGVKVVEVESWMDDKIQDHVGEDLYETFLEEMELLEGVLGPFEIEKFLSGEVSPMTFGSAKYDWGVDIFLKLFTQTAPQPQSRVIKSGTIDPLEEKNFSGFIFKIQANMDKRHRDRVAFVRICSGRFERGMKVRNMRTKKELRLAYANQFLAQDRETIEEAYAGDIVGLNDTGNFQIGDTITSGKEILYGDIPRFSPEHFGRVTIKDALKKKALEKGLKQLVDEGTIQVFMDPLVGWQDPILAVVGTLQFDVLLFRLNDEYGLEARLERLPYTVARWPKDEQGRPKLDIRGAQRMFQDGNEQPVILLQREWDLKFLYKENPDTVFAMTSSVEGLA